jgi:transcriptional regulator with XRE-family HTH domain
MNRKYYMRLYDINLPWTQSELARKLGVSRTHISLLVQGKRKLSRRLAEKLADALADAEADKLHAETVTSNPLGGSKAVFGGFDSHALPPATSLPKQRRFLFFIGHLAAALTLFFYVYKSSLFYTLP